MNNTSNELTNLWQQQGVKSIDMTDLTKRLRRQQCLQRCYIVFDFLGFIPAFILVGMTWQSMSALPLAVLVTIVTLTFAYYVYITWLRRHAVLAAMCDTASYLETLKKQYLNNQKIARLSFHASWASVVAMAVFFVVSVIVGEITLAKLWAATPVLLAMILGCGAFARWAVLREGKFKREYAQLIARTKGLN